MGGAEWELINPDCNWLYTDVISLEGVNLTIYILLIIIIIFWF